jgi:hypothetical protein
MNQKEILFISFTIFLTIIAWSISELYIIHKSTPTESQIESVKLNYSIDTKILDTLQEKVP